MLGADSDGDVAGTGGGIMLREEMFRRHRRRPLPLRHLRLSSGRSFPDHPRQPEAPAGLPARGRPGGVHPHRRRHHLLPHPLPAPQVLAEAEPQLLVGSHLTPVPSLCRLLRRPPGPEGGQGCHGRRVTVTVNVDVTVNVRSPRPCSS